MSISRGRTSALYRMRQGHLALLARMLDAAGHTAVVTEPPGMPVLTIRRPGGSDLDVIVTIGYGDVDWYRWAGGNGGYLAPAAEPDVTLEEIQRALRPCGVRA